MKNKLIKLIITFSLFLSLLFMSSYLYLYNWSYNMKGEGGPQMVELRSQESLKSFSRKVAQLGLVDNELYFRLFLRLGPYDYRAFQAGRYTFSRPLSPQSIMETIQQGQVDHELVAQIVVPEGYSLPQIIERAEKVGMSSKQLKFLAYDQGFVRSLGITARTLEGYIAPATYRFYNEKPTPKAFYTRAVQVFFRRLPQGYDKQLEDLKITLEDAVNIASLIEKETSLPEERSLVSEVIWSRLKKKIPLGIDAALIYGIKDYQGDIKRKHLRDRSNKYNTRIHLGLPPTPIGSPSVASLKAVMSPSNKGYLYYVLKPGKNQKKHYFSKTLKEHNQQVRKLLKGGS